MEEAFPKEGEIPTLDASTEQFLSSVLAKWLSQIKQTKFRGKTMLLSGNTRMWTIRMHDDFRKLWRLLYKQRFGAKLTRAGHSEA